jgi:hypothetical protein
MSCPSCVRHPALSKAAGIGLGDAILKFSERRPQADLRPVTVVTIGALAIPPPDAGTTPVAVA